MSSVEPTFSNTVIACWEKTHGSTVTAKQHKGAILKDLIRVCGLSTSKLSVADLRIMLTSLKKTKLPTSPDEVQRVLKDVYKVPASGVCINHVYPRVNVNHIMIAQIAGAGMRSHQQKALKLLHLMDPDLVAQLGRQTLATGDFTWKDSMLPELRLAIDAMVDKWVIDLPPYGYDTTKPADMKLWDTRRQTGLIWVKSQDVLDFGKYMYRTYSSIFSDVTTNKKRSALNACLESFFVKKRVVEEGDFRDKLKVLLAPLCSLCSCNKENVLDRFSFVVGVMKRAVFDFFSQRVRDSSVKPIPASPRIKDREDEVGGIALGLILSSLLCTHP